jgi:hypothetical protein
MESFDVLSYLLDRFMGLLAKNLLISFEDCPERYRLHIMETGVLLIKEPPDPIEEPGRPLYPLIAPIEILLRWGSEETEHPGCICPIFFNQVFRINDIPLGLRHLLDPSDRDLTSTLTTMEHLSLTFHFIGEEITVLRALIDFFTNHSLGQKIGERFFNAHPLHLFQHPSEKT